MISTYFLLLYTLQKHEKEILPKEDEDENTRGEWKAKNSENPRYVIAVTHVYVWWA